MDNRLHQRDLRVIEKRAERWTDHRLAGNVTILLWHIAAGALAPSARDDDRGHRARHENTLLKVWMALAQVSRMCEPAEAMELDPSGMSWIKACTQGNDIAVQHLRGFWFWLNSKQTQNAA